MLDMLACLECGIFGSCPLPAHSLRCYPYIWLVSRDNFPISAAGSHLASWIWLPVLF